MTKYDCYKFKINSIYIKLLVYVYNVLKHIQPKLSYKLSSYISKELSNLTAKYPYRK